LVGEQQGGTAVAVVRRFDVCRGILTLVVAGLLGLPAGAAAAPAGTTHYPDLQTLIPTNSFSINQDATGRWFRYTHQVYDPGPGPLEIQPQYNPASGTYQGVQQLFTHDASGTWSMVNQVRVADAFVYHAAHGHFHFPLAAFGLYTVAANGGPGAPVSISPKNGFCIDDSYIYDSTVPHAGTFVGPKGPCTDPNALRGMSVGAVDEYDYRDPGQSIPFDGVPDGTYWFRAITDPNNDIVEGNESNNETDVKVTISNGTVTAGEVRHPDTTPPPVTLNAPTDCTAATGSITMSATTAATGGVQFLVDGNLVGTSSSSSSPYTFTWNSSTVTDGIHWIAARATDAQGRVGTSSVAAVAVNNTGANGALAIDAATSTDGGGTLTSPPICTTHPGDVLVAFVGSDGPSSGQAATVSGGGLSWKLVRRSNARPGTAEIWTATAPKPTSGLTVTSTPAVAGYEQSLTVEAFTGSGGVGASSGAGAASGAPSTSLTTSAPGSWVFGIGNDWDRAVSRTVGAGQVMRHEVLDTTARDSFWVQSQNAPTPNGGMAVPISDTAPTTDSWNLAAVEVLAASGSPPVDTQPPTVSVTGPSSGSTVAGPIALSATATDNVGVTKVQFKVDGNPVGGPVTNPPYTVQWDSTTVGDGVHTITAEASDAAGNTGVSPTVSVTVNNSAPPPAVISIDKQVVAKSTGTLTSSGLTTSSAGEQILALVAYDGPAGAGGQRATVSGGGLTWTLQKRSNSQSGVSEIWSATAPSVLSAAQITATPLQSGYQGMLTVIAFKNAAGIGTAGATGAPSGAPDVYLPGVNRGSWVFAVGNDWDRAVGRTPSTGQVLQQQWVDSGPGDTFWVQSPSAPAASSGIVDIHDTAPTNDQWNYAAVEVTPKPGT
jgi:hypothetical protein